MVDTAPFYRQQCAGLSTTQVADSRDLHGSNVLTPAKRDSVWKLYLEKYKDPIIVILIVAAFVSLALACVSGNYMETAGILMAVFLATTIGFYFELDAARKFNILTTLDEKQPVKVRRNGTVTSIERWEVVVGDVVLLSVGDEIPADGTVIRSVNLQVNESTLTGELLTDKSALCTSNDETYPQNMLLRSSMVMNGNAEMVVTAVGDLTEIGKVAQQTTGKTHTKTPLTQQLSQLAHWISWMGGALAVVVFLTFSLHHYINNPALWHSGDTIQVGEVLLRYFMVAVTLLVMAVPEGLPMAITLALALNMRRMLNSDILVRRLEASETMGAVTVICTDKTGTLTENRMRVSSVFSQQSQLAVISYNIAVNSTAELDGHTVVGNPTEAALLRWLESAPCHTTYRELRNKVVVEQQKPFSTETKFMATIAGTPEGRFLFVKGAPEVIFSMTKTTSDELGKIEQQLLAEQEKGLRTLAFASLRLNDDMHLHIDAPLAGLCYDGFASLEDPVRKEVYGSIKTCQRAGIDVKIVTGDTLGTAREVAREIGIWNGKHISGKAFAAMNDREARAAARDICLLYRARPTDKQRLVSVLQQQGNIVAVTGDGTNDAPALHHAEVGLSLGSGTHVAKQASHITLLNDSFESISNAVMWGRSLYKNIQRFLFFQLVVNITALLLVLFGAITGTDLPLTVTQILWVNLIMDTLAAMALASLPPTHAVMKEKPRSRHSFILPARYLTLIGLLGTLFAAVMCVFWYHCEQPGSHGIDLHEMTVFFSTFVMLQMWNLTNAKTLGTTQSVLHNWRKSELFWTVWLLIVAVQWIIVEYGGSVFRTVHLSCAEWAVIFCATAPVAIAGELWRALMRRREQQKAYTELTTERDI